MAVSSHRDVHQVMSQIPDSSRLDVYWYFNQYDANATNDVFTLADGDRHRVRVSKIPGQKSQFWIDKLAPDSLSGEFQEHTFDFIWLLDSDLDLRLFNFVGFIEIVEALNIQISQPLVTGKDPKGWQSDHVDLRAAAVSGDFTALARTGGVVEIEAPLIQFESWSRMHLRIEEALGDGRAKNTSWGPDLWWCGAASLDSAQDPTAIPCAVVHYTPIYHLDTRTIRKNHRFQHAGREAIAHQRALFPQYFKEAKALKSQSRIIHYDEYAQVSEAKTVGEIVG